MRHLPNVQGLSCGSPFTKLKRRHHCRLCGTVLCASCSLGLNTEQAADICLLWKENRDNPDDPILMSGKDDLRMCKVCFGDLTDVQLREQHIQDRNRQRRKGVPGVAKVAKTMQENIAYCMEVLPMYKELAMALLDFKRRDEYDSAVALREAILRRCQAVGMEAKKLKAANIQLKHEVGTDSFNMRGRMMARCTEFLQEHMMGMARLPNREEIESYVPPEEEAEELPKEEQEAPLGTILVEITYDTLGLRGVVPIGMLIMHVVQANGLVIENKSGVCDPFVYVCTCVRVYVCSCVRVFVCSCVRVYVCTRVRVYIYFPFF